MPRTPWLVSLHGGHSFPFSDHGSGPLEDLVEEADAQGFTVYGLTEHAPRVEERHLYTAERNLGWGVEDLLELFEAYAAESRRLAEVGGGLTVLRGFEIEAVPEGYPELVRAWREAHGFEYVVGAVHHVSDRLVDGTAREFEEAAEAAGGVEAMVVRYYERLAEMAAAVRPEVTAHFDLVRRHAASHGAADTPRVRQAVDDALEALRAADSILLVEPSALRRGDPEPYPASWIVKRAQAAGLAFSFGDDAHAADEVGLGLKDCRAHLLAHGVQRITVLAREAGGLGRREVPLS